MPSRGLMVMVMVFVVVAVAWAARGPIGAREAAAASSPCGLRLPAPRNGELLFRTPAGGRAVRRVLVGKIVQCTLTRRDGSRFARLHIDADKHVLGVVFYRPSGALLSAVDSSYAVASQAPANVKCGSSSQAKIGTGFWKKTRKWWIGATPSGLNRDAVVKAVRNAQSEWTNDINWCGIKDQAAPPASYEGKTSNKADKQDGKSVVDWGSLSGQDCAGAGACTYTWYDAKGSPVESDIRFSNAYKWSTSGASGTLDIQSFAAHEIGHVLQFDHVINSAKDDETNVMWPYFAKGDTTGRKLGRGDALEDNSHY